MRIPEIDDVLDLIGWIIGLTGAIVCLTCALMVVHHNISQPDDQTKSDCSCASYGKTR